MRHDQMSEHRMGLNKARTFELLEVAMPPLRGIRAFGFRAKPHRSVLKVELSLGGGVWG